jgi:hypothetical protein
MIFQPPEDWLVFFRDSLNDLYLSFFRQPFDDRINDVVFALLRK